MSKSGFMRTGNCERAPFAGVLPSEVMPLMRTCASSGMMMAAGIEQRTAVGLVTVLLSMAPTAPALTACVQMSKKVADATPELLMSAMRPLTDEGHATVGLSTSA